MSTRSQLTKDLNDSIKVLLGRHTKILVKYMVKLETKNDKTENRVLVFTPVRMYLLTAKVPTRIDCHFHYLDIQFIESKKPTHFSITTNEKHFSFCTIGDAGSFSSLKAVEKFLKLELPRFSYVTAQLSHVTYGIPLAMKIIAFWIYASLAIRIQ